MTYSSRNCIKMTYYLEETIGIQNFKKKKSCSLTTSKEPVIVFFNFLYLHNSIQSLEFLLCKSGYIREVRGALCLFK